MISYNKMIKKTISKILSAAVPSLAMLLLPAGAVQTSAQTTGTGLRVLCLGNSITHHDYDASVGWYGNWGMAASKAENDYCHQLQTMLSSHHAGTVVTPLNMAYWERNLGCNIDSLIGSYAKGKDIIVIRLGDNVSDKTAFKDALLHLVKYCKEKAPRVVITGCYWEDADKDAAIKAVAHAEGIAYIPLSYIDKEDGARATTSDTFYSTSGNAYKVTNDAVLAHPGDNGMLRIAQAIYAVIGGGDVSTLKINIHKTDGNTETYAASKVAKAVFSDATAGDEEQCVVVELGEGGKMTLSLGSSPQLTFDDDSVNIFAGETAARLHAGDIRRITFQSISTSIERMEGKGQSVRNEGGQIVAEGMRSGSRLNLYDATGALLSSTKADASGRAALYTSSLPVGVYLIQAGETTIKFVKK